MADALVRFQVEKPDGTFGDYLEQKTALSEIQQRLADHQPGGFSVLLNHKLVKQGLSTGDTVTYLGRQYDRERAGTLWRIREDDGPFDLRTRKINVDLRVVDTAGNRYCDTVRAVAVALDFADGDAGTAVCKNIGTTTNYSQHNPWKAFISRHLLAGANAIDLIHKSRQRMAEGARYFVAHAERFSVQNVIYWFPENDHPSIWNPERGWHVYVIPPGGSDHRGHYHVDFNPQRGPSYQGAWDTPRC